MKLRELQVGHDYYHERRTRDWERVNYRATDDQRGDYRVRLLGTELYCRGRWGTYERSTTHMRGTYVRVALIRNGEVHGESHVSLASLRGEWASVVAETLEAQAQRQARIQQQRAEQEAVLQRLESLQNRAHAYGLEVTRVSNIGGRHTFRIGDVALGAFLDALDALARGELTDTPS